MNIAITCDRHRDAPVVLGRAARLMDTTMGPEGSKQLREVLTMTGAGNHPAVISFFNKVAQQMAEGRPVPAPGGPAQTPRNRAERRYGNKGT